MPGKLAKGAVGRHRLRRSAWLRTPTNAGPSVDSSLAVRPLFEDITTAPVGNFRQHRQTAAAARKQVDHQGDYGDNQKEVNQARLRRGRLSRRGAR